jgi:hypothetical protein
MVRTGLWGWTFVFRHFGSAVGLSVLLVLTELLLFFFFTRIMGFIPAEAMVMILVLFLWQQLHALARSGLKVMTLASESALYLRLWKEDEDHEKKRIPKNNRARDRRGGIHRKQSRRPASG